uniref:Lipid droplet-associated serine hydrolase n=1 Tax=Strongyloides venezuelensis TaxID=75913 RepID=A0A0K0FEV6_STRVS
MVSGDNLSKVPIFIKGRNGLVQINAEIQDTHPLGSGKGNVVFIGDCPGTHKDFEYMVDILKKKGIRCICINFPGLGHTPYYDIFKHTNKERIHFVMKILKNIDARSNLVFVGHSRGSENALKLATLLGPNTVGTLLINPIPVLPYRELRENYWTFKIFGFLLKSSGIVYFIFSRIALVYYNWYYSKSETNPYVVGSFYQCMSSINLRDQLPFIDKFNTQKTKLLISYGGDDPSIETSVSLDFVSRFELDNQMVVDEETPEDLAKFRMVTFYQNGLSKLGCFFKDGNHYLQKNKADFLVSAILCMLDLNYGRSSF